LNRENKRGVLLASFIPTDDEEKILAEVEHIAATVNLTNNLIFLLGMPDDPDRRIITYNAFLERGKPLNSRLFTMRVHRKKNSNTLYTINALNKAVALEHDGQTGRHLKLDWENYKNSIMLLTGNELKVYNVEVVRIYKIEEEPSIEQ
jgi:hypothetical protein